MATFHPERTSEQAGTKTGRRGDDSQGCRARIPKSVSSVVTCIATDPEFGKIEISYGESNAETGETAEGGRYCPQKTSFYFLTTHNKIKIRRRQKKSNGTASSQISPRGYRPRHLIIAIDHAISLSLNQHLKGRQKNKNVESKLELPCINASGNAKKEEMQSKPELPCINQSWNAE